MLELSILKALLLKSNYIEFRDKLDIKDVQKELQSLLRVIDTHFSVDEASDLTVDDLSNLFFAGMPRDKDYYIGVIEAIKSNEAGTDSVRKLIDGLQRARKLRELSLSAYDASEGRKDPLEVFNEFNSIWTSNGDSDDGNVNEDFISSDLERLVDSSRSVAGLRFRLNSLNKSLGSLRQGDFGFVFARPETGKTTLLASEVTFMASQATRPILWLNNEEVGSKVMLRCYQAALGIDLANLYRDIPGNRNKFIEATKDNIKLKDSAEISRKEVEKLVARHQPALIVFDQIDKIKGFDSDREDLRLGAIYIWARELAKSYCPVIGVCQADGTGEGQRWLTMANVANAKTSKQAEADWILGLGRVNDVGFDNIRYLHLSKNKLFGDVDSDPSLRHGRWEVLIDPEVARYRDFN